MLALLREMLLRDVSRSFFVAKVLGYTVPLIAVALSDLLLFYTTCSVFTLSPFVFSLVISSPSPYPSLPQLRKDQRKVIFKRAEQYVKEYRQRELDEIRMKREARKRGNYYVPDEAKVVFVIRIRGLACCVCL